MSAATTAEKEYDIVSSRWRSLGPSADYYRYSSLYFAGVKHNKDDVTTRYQANSFKKLIAQSVAAANSHRAESVAFSILSSSTE